MLRFDSMPNFRQLLENGIETDEPKTKRIRLFRSSRPDFLTTDEINQFRSAGIRCVIDFRSSTEYRKASGRKLLDNFYPVYKVKLPFSFHYKPSDKVNYIPLTLKPRSQNPSPAKNQSNNSNEEKYGGPCGRHFLIDFFKINYIWTVYNRAPWYIKLYSLFFLFYDVLFFTGYRYFVRVFARHVLNQEGLFGQYCDMINYSQSSICAALKLLSDPENIPAMLNCAHGKDRTGIVSALVLACLGKSKEEIALDYAKSETELEPVRERIEHEIIDRFHMCKTFVSAKSETMIKVLDYLDDNYGSVSNYLESIGFPATDQEKLRRNLTTM